MGKNGSSMNETLFWDSLADIMEVKIMKIISEGREEFYMAFFDWNGDGKKDFTDDFIEYHIYKQSTSKKSDNSYVPQSGGGSSTFGAIAATVGGLFLAAAIVALFGGGEDAPVVITLVLWMVCSVGLGVWFDKVGF